MRATSVLTPVKGRAVPMEQVPDPVFAQLMTGPGAAVDPPREVVDAVAPVSGKVFKLYPHAFVILTAEGVAVLVHLGIDTVQLSGQGFTTHVQEGDDVTAGQLVTTYDVPAVEAAGRNPIVPVIAKAKADAVAKAVEGPVSSMCPGSALQLHRDANVIVDEAAASRLTLADYYRYTFANRPPWQRFETPTT